MNDGRRRKAAATNRGHVLLLLMTFLTVGTIGFAVMASSLNQRISTRHSAEVRLQTLWLARSALSAGVTGKKEVSTPYGLAQVQVEKSKDGKLVAHATLVGAVAEISRTPSDAWLERYDSK